MTIVADRNSVSSGTITPTDPPPDLSHVDDAQEFYLAGRAGLYSTGPIYGIMPGAMYLIEPGNLGRLLAAVTEQLARLRVLHPGWDGYRAEPITEKALYGVGRVLEAVLGPDSVVPQFAPLVDGGVQIEWLAGGDDISVEVSGSGDVDILAVDASGETIADGTLDVAFPGELAITVAAFLRALSARVTAARAIR